jgi:hypothetical protein
MARFVNYQKRGVELPPGCKDLIDVLKRKQKAEGPGAFAGNWEPMPNADFFPSGGIRQIERYVTRVLSSARFAVLLVMSLDGRVLIQLARNPGEAAFDLVLLAQPDDQGLEQAVRGFFRQQGIDNPLGCFFSGGVNPIHTGALKYRLLSDPTWTAVLLADLLKGVFALDAEAGLAFTYHESFA